MKKRFLTLMLTCCLLLTTPALATNSSSANFVRINTYSGQFSDLGPDSTFYSNVSALYEYGLSVGKPDGTFGLKDSLTVGQAVIFAGRIRSLYRTGNPETGPAAYQSEDQPTAMPYLLYLQSEGVLDTALDNQLAATATRAQMAHILANILPENVLPSTHSTYVNEWYAARRAITDVTEYTPYYQDILALYRKGICIGSDQSGSFLPNTSITRGAAAAMLTRMVDSTLRVTPKWTLPAGAYPSAIGTTFAALITPGSYIQAPTTMAEMDSAVRYMLSTDSNQLTLKYPNISATQTRQIMDAALSCVKQYCEQSYNSVSADFTLQGDVTLTFSAVGVGEGLLPTYRDATMQAAIAVHDQLWAEGIITADMTDREKARVYYTWVCENCVYDDAATDDSLSHIAYSLFKLGTAVCDGYTSAYNLLLSLEDISCVALSSGTHIWTVASLDGKEFHIDTTWGDSFDEISYAFFAMPPQTSWKYHPW